MLLDTADLPPVEDLDACAAWKVAHDKGIHELLSWTATTSRALKKRILETGMPVGKVGLVSFGGWDYPITIVDEMPDVGYNNYSFRLGAKWDHARVLEVLLEMLPELEDELRAHWKVMTVVNVQKCLQLMEDDGEMGRRIRRLRERKSKLGVVR